MKELRKILIAYDGSSYSDAALDDLPRAGLPRRVEALVVSVADVLMPPPESAEKERIDSTFPFHVPHGVKVARERDAQKQDEARSLALEAGRRLRSYFPEWEVRDEALTGTPALEIMRKADEWKADLIVVGSQGRSALGRLILGSVSQKVVNEAKCSVRVARGQDKESDSPVCVVIGVDGSREAETAVRAVAARVWSAGSEARVIAVQETIVAMIPAIEVGIEAGEAKLASLRHALESAADVLRAAGLVVSTVIKKGNPKQMLIEEAEQWKADCIFVGARGLGALERILLGSVSTAVVTRARCSVEVVRA